MAPKKKAPAAVGGNNDDGEDDSTDKLWKLYRKNCTILDIAPNKRLKEMYEVEYLEEQKHFTKVSLCENNPLRNS